ncbi:MAG: hypothetical protein ACXVZX_10030 [Terriglobales bacterium]
MLIALLAIAPFASAKTTTTKHHSTTPSVKSTTTKSNSTKSHRSTSKTAKSSAHSSRSKHSKSSRSAKKSWKSRGQHGISADRAKEIQDALIQQHYLDASDATGVWDTKTQEACRKLQADNGWQTKVLPDSRALIKLGLGPDHKDVLNPETAATSPYLPGGGVKSDSLPAAASTAVVPEQ